MEKIQPFIFYNLKPSGGVFKVILDLLIKLCSNVCL